MGLFDFSFTKFITPTVIRVIYIIAMVGLVLGYLVAVIATFNQDAAGGVVVLLLGPIGVFLYLLLIRVVLEGMLAAIRTAQNTGELVRLQQGPAGMAPQGQPFGGPPPGYGQPPPPPPGYPNQ